MSDMTVIEPEIVKAEIVQYLGGVIEEARERSLTITDDETCGQAVTLGAQVKDKIKWLKERRKAVYEPLKAATENVRMEYDNPLKMGEQIEKTLAAAVITYKQKKRAEEERLRLEKEAEARKQREEASRKEREAAAERERIIKERQVEEQRKRDEAEAAERRRKEEEDRVRREAEAKAKAEADARAKQLKEEEDRRVANAKEAEDRGMADRADTILDKQQPVAPLPAPLPTPADLAAKAEAERIERERIAAEEKAKVEAKIAEEKKRQEDADRLKRMDDEAAAAKAKAAETEAEAAQQVTVARPDERMRTNVSWKYDVPDVAAIKKLCLAVAQGRAPVEYIGFDPEQPQKFRAAAIQKDVTRMKGEFQGEAVGIRTWPEESGSFKAAA